LISDPLSFGPVDAFVALLEELVVVLEDAVTDRALSRGDAIDRALTWVGATQGVLTLGKLSRFDPNRFNTARLVDTLTETLLAGWGAKGADVRRASSYLTRLEEDGLLSRTTTQGDDS
jgi:hypothetical protein